MQRLKTLATSNSTWLAVSNLVWCALVELTPLLPEHSKARLYLFVACNLAFVAWKYFSGTLPAPEPMPQTRKP